MLLCLPTEIDVYILICRWWWHRNRQWWPVSNFNVWIAKSQSKWHLWWVLIRLVNITSCSKSLHSLSDLISIPFPYILSKQQASIHWSIYVASWRNLLWHHIQGTLWWGSCGPKASEPHVHMFLQCTAPCHCWPNEWCELETRGCASNSVWDRRFLSLTFSL